MISRVEAPGDGDAICTLQKTYDKAQKGRVFVRRHGKTEEADPAEMRALEERIRTQRPKVDLAVTRADRKVLRTLSASAADKRAWLVAEDGERQGQVTYEIESEPVAIAVAPT